MESRTIAYWVTTVLFSLVLGFSGTAHTLHLEFMVVNMTAMGFPLYFMTIIGVFKLLGVAALLAPGLPLLKEWAYAGFVFNLVGAAALHLFSGDEFSHWIRPLFALGLGVASYLLRPDSRRLNDSVRMGAAGRLGASAPSTAS